MRYLASYLLAQIGGVSRPQEDDIRNILSSVGIDCDKDRVKMVIEQMHGKSVNELINAGKEKMATVSFSAASLAAAPSDSAPVVHAEAPVDDVKASPVKEEKESEESDGDMGFNLFD